MGFITNSLDMRKLARNLDKKHTLAISNSHELTCNNFGGLSEYMIENVLLPIVSTGVIAVGTLDFSQITEDSLTALESVCENISDSFIKHINLSLVFASCPAFAIEQKTII